VRADILVAGPSVVPVLLSKPPIKALAISCLTFHRAFVARRFQGASSEQSSTVYRLLLRCGRSVPFHSDHRPVANFANSFFKSSDLAIAGKPSRDAQRMVHGISRRIPLSNTNGPSDDESVMGLCRERQTLHTWLRSISSFGCGSRWIYSVSCRHLGYLPKYLAVALRKSSAKARCQGRRLLASDRGPHRR